MPLVTSEREVVNLMISWYSDRPDDLKLTDVSEAGVYIPASARDMAWLVSAVRRIGIAAARRRRYHAQGRLASLVHTKNRRRAAERSAREDRPGRTGGGASWAAEWRQLMEETGGGLPED